MKQILLAAPVALLLFACSNGDGRIYQGYVEAEYVDVAAGIAGRVAKVAVNNGDTVQAEQLLFQLEGEIEQTQAKAAEANLKIAQLNLKRLQNLSNKDFYSQQNLDQAQAALTVAEQEMKAANWRLGQVTQLAPSSARVTEVLHRPGEWLMVGQPVVRILPDGNTKLRFFVPETELGKWQLGDPINASCDGCGDPISAKVSFISSETEYTPPVIFSTESREKLVVMMEAKLSAPEAARLHVGQPVDVMRVSE